MLNAVYINYVIFSSHLMVRAQQQQQKRRRLHDCACGPAQADGQQRGSLPFLVAFV